MKLLFSPNSPFARKVMVVAHELGVEGTIEKINATPHPVNRDPTVVVKNPLGKVPTAILEDGRVLIDSRVIAEYVAAEAGDKNIFPQGEARWLALSQQALADGLLDASMLVRWELVARPKELHWDGWIEGQREKVRASLVQIEGALPPSEPTIGAISIGCALGYLDLRFPEMNWRGFCPKAAAWFATFDARPSMAKTRPPPPA